MTRKAAILVLTALCLAACGTGRQETPQEGIQAIIELFSARDFDTLVHTRYAEIAKAENEEQIRALIEGFYIRYRKDGTLRLAIATYRAALEIEPELSEDGTVATFRLRSGSLILSRMPDGKWGFHL